MIQISILIHVLITNFIFLHLYFYKKFEKKHTIFCKRYCCKWWTFLLSSKCMFVKQYIVVILCKNFSFYCKCQYIGINLNKDIFYCQISVLLLSFAILKQFLPSEEKSEMTQVKQKLIKIKACPKCVKTKQTVPCEKRFV